MTPFAIRTLHLGRDFGSTRALDDLTLEIPRGSIFGYLGPNGSGKTTTIRLLLGLLQPTRGSAEVLGCDVRTQADAIRLRCGALLEHTGLYERLSAYDNLEFYGRVWRLPAADRQARIRALLEGLNLWDRRGDLVGAWSRGMKQKLAVARALLHRPELIFLDEPTAGLDPMAAAALREDLANLARTSGVTVFLTTHNLAEAEALCSMVAVVRQGRLLRVGAPGELRQSSGAPLAEVYGRGFTEAVLAGLRARPEVNEVVSRGDHLALRLASDADLAGLVAWLVGQGVQIEELRRGQSSLEDTFLTLMKEESSG